MASRLKITCTQAGIRLAVEEHPEALYVFGNAPTALMELCKLMRQDKAHPIGVIGAPVGFVNVRESKHMLKSFTHLPKLVIEGRKEVVTSPPPSSTPSFVSMTPHSYDREETFEELKMEN